MPTLTSVTKFFPSAKEGFTTTLASTISSKTTTVPLNSVTGYTNGDTIVLVVDPGNSSKQVFTGVVDTSGVQITGVVWTEDTNVTHTAGATVVDYVTATHIAMTTKGLLVEHKQTGAHKDVTADSLTINSGGNIDLPSGGALRDENNNELLKTTQTASAVNEITVTNAATGNPPTISATGGDTNISLKGVPKGTGIASGFMTVKIGTVTIANGVTGNQSVTGLGFKPKAVMFSQLAASSATINNVMQGAMDSSGNQYANSAHNDQGGDNSGNSSLGACILDFTTDRSIIHQAEYVSMDTDGFTIHTTTATGTQAYGYIAFG